MKRAERIITILLLFVIGLSNVSTPVSYAAQIGVSKLASQSSGHSSSTTPVAGPKFSEPGSGSVLGASTSLFAIGTESLDVSQGTLSSASKRIPIRMQQLDKKVYQTDEDVTLAVNNPDNDPFSTSVVDAKGQTVTVPITESNNGTTTDVQISGSNEITPGKYTIKVTDQEGDVTTQDFSWGVLALNTDKSMYHPGETADLSMAVLDDQGNMVCNANLELGITNSELGIDNMLSTNEASGSANLISVNPQCQQHDFSLQPDYEAHYQFGKAGTYNLQLTATTTSGTHSITDTVQVTNQIPFDVQRVSATRIYPPNTYPMTFNITAHRNFSGTVTETVPEDFTITPATQSANTNSYDNMQTVYLNSNDPAAQLQEAITASGSGGLVMPFQGNYPITQGFGAQLTDPTLQAFYTQYGLAGHDGVDFGVPMDTPLYAVDDGNVIWSGPGDYGTTIIIQHSWGQSYYGHLSTTAVNVGAHVNKGELIGYSGESGEATGPHLHFGMRPNNPDMTNGYYGKIDPLPYLPYGHAAEATTGIGPSISLPGEQNTLGASTSADASDSAAISPTSTPIPSLLPSGSPIPSSITPTLSTSSGPTATPVPTEELNPSPSPSLTPSPSVSSGSSTTPAANENFSVLDNQIMTNEELANSSDTEKVKVITWHVTLKKGDSTTLGYDYQTPLVSPQFYLLGPVQFYQNGSNKVVFQEQRQWEIAADDVGVEWYSNSTGNKFNGYSWQYRKKIDINHSEVTGLSTTATPTFMESGSDATQDDSLYTNSSCTSDNSIAETGPRSIKCLTDGSGDNVDTIEDGVTSDSGTRISQYINLTQLPVTSQTVFLQTINGSSNIIFKLVVKPSTGDLDLENGPGSIIGPSGPALSIGTWYRISIAYTVTGTTSYVANVYLNGVPEIEAKDVAGTCTIGPASGGGGSCQTLAGTGGVNLNFGLLNTAAGDANHTIHFDDIYVDNGSDGTDPGDIHVTAKLPISNGASNPYTTSGTPSGDTVCTIGTHCEYVNERPLRNPGALLTTTTNASSENFTIQGASSGDVNITNATLIGDESWVFAGVGTACTGDITNNGTNTPISLTTTANGFIDPVSITSYPSGNQAVGIESCNTSTLSLYEAGMLIAYIPQVSATSLSNFPVLVNLSTDSDLAAHAQTSGNDILFTDSTGENLLPFEIESYNNSTGSLQAWVDVSSLSSSSDTIIYMYYGNPAATSQANAPNTWNSNYAAVWHFADNAANTTVNESTADSYTGTSVQNTSAIHTTSGQIDGAFTFNGSSDFVKKSVVSGLDSITTVTVSAWVNTSTASEQVFSSGNGSSSGYELLINGSDVCVWSGSNLCSTINVANGSWHYIVGVWDGTNVTVYADGVELLEGAGTITTQATLDNQIGAKCTAAGSTTCSSFFNGIIDEVNVSNGALSPGWISTAYNNQSAPGSFYSLGSVETKIFAPQLSQLMRNGEWFNSEGQVQPFTF